MTALLSLSGGDSLILLWFVAVMAAIIGAHWWTSSLPLTHPRRVIFRSFAWCLLLSPTLVVGGYSAFPAPASMMIAACLFWPKSLGSATRGNLLFALLMLILTSILTISVRLFRQRMRRKRARKGWKR